MTIIDAIIDDVANFYGKRLNDYQADFWRAQLSHLDETDLCAGVIAMKSKEPTNWLPAANTVKRYYLEARENRLNQEKARAPVYSDLERVADRTQQGRDAIRLMMALSENKMSRKDYVSKMQGMDGKYPGLGWGDAAKELAEFWASEPKRHEVGAQVMDRIWALQRGKKTAAEPRKIEQRQFESAEAKENFYRKLFSMGPREPGEDG